MNQVNGGSEFFREWDTYVTACIDAREKSSGTRIVLISRVSLCSGTAGGLGFNSVVFTYAET